MMLTAAELAAYLGVTPSAVRHIIKRHRIQSVGKLRAIGRAKLYDPQAVLAVTGRQDRLAKSADVASH